MASLLGNGPRPAARRAKGGMFTIIRKFRLTRGSAVEVSRRVREGFVPLLQELPGFRGYYLLEGGPDVLISVRVFNSADEAPEQVVRSPNACGVSA
jgi:heme-degrading monooxygenase HmoA